VGFVVEKVALGQIFSEYFGFPCQSSFHQLLDNHHHRSSGAGTIGQQWPTYQVDSVSPHPEKLKKKTTIRDNTDLSTASTDLPNFSFHCVDIFKVLSKNGIYPTHFPSILFDIVLLLY
jgi:hypothetical protein